MGISRTARPAPRVLAAALTVLAAVLPAAPAAALWNPGPAAGSAGPADTRTAEPRGEAPGEEPGGREDGGEGGLLVTPARVRPGAEVELRAESCEGTVVTARSEAFVAEALLSPAPGGGLRGEAVVRSDAGEKEHEITVECADARITGRVTVHRGAAGSTSPPPAPHGEPSAGGPLPSSGPASSPVAPVPAGGGGTAGDAPADAGREGGAADAGPGALHTVVGLGLAGTAALVAVRRTVLQRRGAAGGPGAGDGD